MPQYVGLEHFRVYSGPAKHVIHIPLGHGEEIRSYLQEQGVASKVSQNVPASYDRVEVERRVNAEALQGLLDKRS